MIDWLTKNPNRVAIYLTVLGDVLAAVLVVAADLQSESAIAVLTAAVAVNAKVLVWLKGWQQTEKASYQARLTNLQREAVAEQQEREAALVQAAGQVPGRSRVNLPR